MISALTRVDNRVPELSVPGAAQGEFYRGLHQTRGDVEDARHSGGDEMDDGRYEPAIGDRLAGQRREQGSARGAPPRPSSGSGYSGSSSTRPRTR